MFAVNDATAAMPLCPPVQTPPPEAVNSGAICQTSTPSGDRLREPDTYVPVVMSHEELWAMIERNMGHPRIPVTDW